MRGSLVLVDAADLAESMLIAAALSFEAFGANLSVIHEAAARMRPHAGEVAASARLRELMAGSGLWRSRRRAQPPGPAVDPLRAADRTAPSTTRSRSRAGRWRSS